MEIVAPQTIQFKERHQENETVYTWTDGDEELVRLTAKDQSSYYPKIEFVIKKDIIPYYEEDNVSALDEIREMGMYSEMKTRIENGYVHGSMKCSHNASLGVGSMVQSIKGWMGKYKN